MNELINIIRKIAVEAAQATLKPMSLQTGTYDGEKVRLESQLDVTPIIPSRFTGYEVEVSGILNGEAVEGTLTLTRELKEGDSVKVLKHDGRHKYEILDIL